MTIALAHQPTRTGHLALTEASHEAVLRKTSLVVIHVVEAIDLDNTEAFKAGISNEIADVVAEAGLHNLDWRLVFRHREGPLRSGRSDPERGHRSGRPTARHRCPSADAVGKFLLGSATQSMILNADLPVMVVKS